MDGIEYVSENYQDFLFRPLEEFEDYLKTRVPLCVCFSENISNVKVETNQSASWSLLKVGRNFVATSGKEMLKFQDGQVEQLTII